jgi:CRP-like cAMP-binding protein
MGFRRSYQDKGGMISMAVTDDLQLIGQTPPFRRLLPAELQVVHQSAWQRRVERDAYFYHQGDPATTFYILVEGPVKLTEVASDGQQILVRFVGPGEAMGIVAALSKAVYPLSAQAVDDCLAWDGEILEQLMERYPRMAIDGLRLVSQRWYELEERFRELATERVERRVAQALCASFGRPGAKWREGC